MTATLHELRPAEPDPLAELHAERAKVTGELERLGVVDARMAAAEAKLAEIDAALGALDRADREAVERWAETAEGEPPSPLLDERRALFARRLEAEAERQAAEIAVAATAPKRTGLIHRLTSIGAQITARQIAAAVEQARDVHSEVVKLIGEVSARMIQLEALRQSMIEGQAESVGRREETKAAAFRKALAEIETNFRVPEIVADPAAVQRLKREWRERLR